MDRTVFRIDHAPATFCLDLAHGGQSLRQAVAHAGAMGNLIEAVWCGHRPDPHGLEQPGKSRGLIHGVKSIGHGFYFAELRRLKA